MSDLPTIKQIREWSAGHNAARHLALFAKTGNGLLIWSAYREYRSRDLDVPEVILKKLDQYAARLLDGDGTDLHSALDLGFNEKGGAGPRGDLAAKQRSRDIVERVRDYRAATDRTLTAAFAAAAKDFGTTPAAVKRLWYDWPKRSRRW